MEGLLAGDDDAIRALYRRFGRPVYTVGLRLLGTREAADELTQDVFLTAWRKAARFDPARGRLSTWLMTIAHNLAVDRLRRDTGVSRPHLVLVDEVPDRPAGDEEYALIELDPSASYRLNHIGAPVFGPDGDVTLGLFLIGFLGGVRSERVPEYAARLLAGCERVTKGIQGKPPGTA